MLGSNNIQFRYVRRKVVESNGITWKTELQFRTKDITSSILGIIPLSSTWSDWQGPEDDGFIYVDTDGQTEITP